jgi:hypothetical protein
LSDMEEDNVTYVEEFSKETSTTNEALGYEWGNIKRTHIFGNIM